MKDTKVNYRLVNVVLIALLIWILIVTSHFWLWWATKLFQIIVPFILAFVFAYMFHPFLKWMEKKGIPKYLGITFIIVLILGLVGLLISLMIPLVYDQTVSLISNSIKFIQDISKEYTIDLNFIQDKFSDINTVVLDFGKYISSRAITIITASITFFTILIISFFVGIYMLLDMDKFRKSIKIYFLKRNKKTYDYVRTLDHQMRNYFVGTGKYIFVQLIEYTLVYYIIGHPYFLILGILAAFTTIIPYFGGFIAGILALVTAIVVDSKLFVLTLIVTLILPQLDGYFWSPKIYGKTNDIHPILTIFCVFAGGALMGITGIVIALPITIILQQTIKYYKPDIQKIKGRKKESNRL